jgi:general secretion pathway protein G
MLTKLRAAAGEESGFTLVELLIVIAIMGVLAGVVVFSVAGISDSSQTSACKAEASTVKSAEEAYYVKNKAYGTASDLTTAPNKLLGATPTLVTITLGGTPSGSSYTLAWAGACTTASGLPASP